MSPDMPRVLAFRAFWTEHPLCQLYALTHGQWVGGRYKPAATFSLRELIAFAETLPGPYIERLTAPD